MNRGQQSKRAKALNLKIKLKKEKRKMNKIKRDLIDQQKLEELKRKMSAKRKNAAIGLIIFIVTMILIVLVAQMAIKCI